MAKKKKLPIGRVDGRTLAGKRRQGKPISKQSDKHNLFARVSEKRRAQAEKDGVKLRSNGTPLITKQAHFIEHYLGDANLNATRAAILAGYSEKSARVQGCRLLARANIQKHLRKRINNRNHRMELSQNRILRELVTVAHSRPGEFAVWNGHSIEVKASSEIPEELQGAIKSIEPKFAKDGTAALKITFYDKLKAAELLMRHMGMLELTTRDGSKGSIAEFMTRLHTEAAKEGKKNGVA